MAVDALSGAAMRNGNSGSQCCAERRQTLTLALRTPFCEVIRQGPVRAKLRDPLQRFQLRV